MRRFAAIAVISWWLRLCVRLTSPTPSRSPRLIPRPSATPSPTPELGTVPPEWLFTRPLPVTDTGFGEVRHRLRELRVRRFNLPDSYPPLPGHGFASARRSGAGQGHRPIHLAAGAARSRADQLDWICAHVRGFDGKRHSGELLAHEDVSADLVTCSAHCGGLDSRSRRCGSPRPASST